MSNPKHNDYGNHLSSETVDGLVTPDPQAMKNMEAWLKSFNISIDQVKMSPAKDFWTITATTRLVQTMLQCNYSVFSHPQIGNAVRTLEYSLPELISKSIDFIYPTTSFYITRPQIFQSIQSEGKRINTPEKLKRMYNMQYKPKHPKTKIAVAGFLDDCGFAGKSDLDQFVKKYQPGSPNPGFRYQGVLGLKDNQSDIGVEPNLDIQTIIGLTSPTNTTFYKTPGLPAAFNPEYPGEVNDNEPYIEWLQYMATVPDQDLPQVVSISYGDSENTVPFDYANRVCNEFAKLGARGVSILFSSGDYGVQGGSDTPCSKATPFRAIFPASCPWVTAVGGTFDQWDDEGKTSTEVTWIGSGGGFSNYFARPSYQDAHVTKYLNSFSAEFSRSVFNASGRAYPDVAAQAVAFPIFVNGKFQTVDGTSASAPVFASVISNLNDMRMMAGKKPLGFLNPWLYQNGYKGLNDVMKGYNPGCDTSGFPASKEWDPNTGLGTPDFEKLMPLAAT